MSVWVGALTCDGERQAGRVLVDRVYKERFYDQDTYEFLARRSEYYRDLAADLTVELTRAVNLVADLVIGVLTPRRAALVR